MTRKASPQNQNTVPVLNTDGTPLTPTKPSRARRWIESRKATKEWRHGLFAVRLVDNLSNPQTADISLNIDPGSKVTGITIVAHQDNQEATAIAAFELHHRGHQVTQNLIKRQGHRKNRRSRLRRRPARFNNRRRKEGWLPPSLRSRLSNVTTTVRHLRELFPIRRFLIETSIFDPRLLRDPDIEGEGYQHSERGAMQIREYVLQRDKRTCQYQKVCKGTRTKRIEVDHIVPRSKNGADRDDCEIKNPACGVLWCRIPPTRCRVAQSGASRVSLR